MSESLVGIFIDYLRVRISFGDLGASNGPVPDSISLLLPMLTVNVVVPITPIRPHRLQQ